MWPVRAHRCISVQIIHRSYSSYSPFKAHLYWTHLIKTELKDKMNTLYEEHCNLTKHVLWSTINHDLSENTRNRILKLLEIQESRMFRCNRERPQRTPPNSRLNSPTYPRRGPLNHRSSSSTSTRAINDVFMDLLTEIFKFFFFSNYLTCCFFDKSFLQHYWFLVY